MTQPIEHVDPNVAQGTVTLSMGSWTRAINKMRSGDTLDLAEAIGYGLREDSRARHTADRYRLALERIVTECGAVCEEFEFCAHRSCRDSCGAVLIALGALRPATSAPDHLSAPTGDK